ncbi:MAG TPA: lipoate--protein ligase family protein [Methylomirabilota bacterium]|nr:lipoate--protein ligase family protein [Methylomirabilota bacterium]
MKLFDCSFNSPAENLACDEALLDWCEENTGEEVLRFWESPTYFVVVGYANKIATEVNVANCEAKEIPILRRCSGGGTVLQGRGCLNYALILRIAENSPLASISSANQFIMERNRKAIESEVRSQKPEVGISISGHTDLALRHLPSDFRPLKFSGNSQRRHKNFLLFHGTFLLDFNLSLVSECLRMPSKQPNYRSDRSHDSFLTNLNLSADKVKAAMRKIWKAQSPLENPPLEKISELAHEKYLMHEWNWKF